MRFTALFFLFATASVGAFVPQQHVVDPISKTSTERAVATNQAPATSTDVTNISYGEQSRQYRRTVYTHDDWVKHRSPDRFIRNILSTTASGVYKNVGREVLATTTVATIAFLWNMLTDGYTDFEGVKHDAVLVNQFIPMLTLPLTPFTLASPSLGLLLGKCYRKSIICHFPIFWSSAFLC